MMSESIRFASSFSLLSLSSLSADSFSRSNSSRLAPCRFRLDRALPASVSRVPCRGAVRDERMVKNAELKRVLDFSRGEKQKN